MTPIYSYLLPLPNETYFKKFFLNYSSSICTFFAIQWELNYVNKYFPCAFPVKNYKKLELSGTISNLLPNVITLYETKKQSLYLHFLRYLIHCATLKTALCDIVNLTFFWEYFIVNPFFTQKTYSWYIIFIKKCC